MSYLHFIFLIGTIVSAVILWLKSAELGLGKKIIFQTARDKTDFMAEILPRIVFRQTKLYAARFSLKIHEWVSMIHDGIGNIRKYFRRYTIKLFASAHDQSRIISGRYSDSARPMRNSSIAKSG